MQKVCCCLYKHFAFWKCPHYSFYFYCDIWESGPVIPAGHHVTKFFKKEKKVRSSFMPRNGPVAAGLRARYFGETPALGRCYFLPIPKETKLVKTLRRAAKVSGIRSWTVAWLFSLSLSLSLTRSTSSPWNSQLTRKTAQWQRSRYQEHSFKNAWHTPHKSSQNICNQWETAARGQRRKKKKKVP